MSPRVRTLDPDDLVLGEPCTERDLSLLDHTRGVEGREPTRRLGEHAAVR